MRTGIYLRDDSFRLFFIAWEYEGIFLLYGSDV